MKLKNILYACIIGAVALSSCSKKLELRDPQTLTPQEAVGSDANIKTVLLGGYDAMSSSNMYGGNAQLFADLLASDGEVSWVGTFNTYREVWGKNLLTTNPIISGIWGAGYNTINIANTVLANIDKVNAADQNRVKGEALWIRGTMHFELVRYFAKDFTDGNPSSNPGIPIMTAPTPTLDDVTKPARNKVAEVYNQVINDLTQAENLLPNSNGVFATKSAAAAILSRVYLQQANYAAARDAANRGILNATGKSLLSSFMSNFNQSANTAEDIFAIQVNDQDGANNLQVFYANQRFGGRSDIEIESRHLNLYEPGDVRGTVVTNPTASSQPTSAFYFISSFGAVYTTKWRDLYKNVKVIRLAELYLTRAEANFRLGTAVGDTPLNDINRIRTRAGVAPLLVILNVNQIYLERRRELAFEGFGIHDARRFRRTVDGRAWNENRLVFPIPFREMNANPSLTQNPGY
ncbi:MAG TPA: RagB/SusD family nutrient uptake outer membrane protein [Flavisolibacter sp.]|nr:RagB/SusD family nutrient uptake outer membrane protein [Flavisolibacter sp.]